ncbi:MAG: hypothetical protein ABIH78_00975 [Candidatus Peregrinibacteria bacterium]
MENIKKIGIVRALYLYIVTAISVVILIVSMIGLINLVLKEYVFDVKGWEELDTMQPEMYYGCTDDALLYKYDPASGAQILKDPTLTSEQKEILKADCLVKATENAEFRHANEVKRELVLWLSMLIVALPIYLYHWGIIKKEAK